MADTQTLVKETAAPTPPGETYAVAATFDHPDKLMAAIKELRKSGYTQMEAFTPFPIHGIDDALGSPRSPLGYMVFFGGLTGFTFGTLLQWWTSAVDYSIQIGGKPFFAFPSSIPVMFESTILFSAFTAVFGMLLGLCGLPRLYHPIFNYSQSKRITDDAFVLVIKKIDPQFNETAVRGRFEGLGATSVEVVEE
jgi:hypothetical protein